MTTLMDHTISVHSEVGKGSTFSVTMRKGSPNKVRQKNFVSTPVWDMSGLKVMALDDNPDVRDALHTILANWQCDVRAQKNVALPDNWSPEFIISDYHLEDDITGTDAVTLMRNQIGKCVPAVILTGDHAITLPVDANRMTLLRKPVRPAQLRSVMQKMLSPSTVR